MILGHRGYRALYPENTLLAFRAALDAGADGVECDLQKTADGRYVVIHDPTPERTTGVSGVVARMSFEELRSLDAGRGERVPELGELLGALPPGTYLDLELKEETLSPRDCGAIDAILDNRFDRDRLMISSFVPRLLTPFRRRGYRVGLLVGERLAAFGALPLLPLVLLVRPGFVNLPVDMFRSLGERRARSLVALLRSLGLSVLFWTVNTESEAARIAGLADIVVTDEVEKMRRLVG